MILQELQRRNVECAQLQSLSGDLQTQITNDFLPKIQQCDALVAQISAMQKELSEAQTAHKQLATQSAQQQRQIAELSKLNAKLNKDLRSKRDCKQQQVRTPIVLPVLILIGAATDRQTQRICGRIASGEQLAQGTHGRGRRGQRAGG